MVKETHVIGSLKLLDAAGEGNVQELLNEGVVASKREHQFEENSYMNKKVE